MALKLAKVLKDYDLIIDFHNTKDSTCCSIVCCYPNRMQIEIAKHFGLANIVIMPDNGCLIGGELTEKSISHEISYQNKSLLDLSNLYNNIEALSRGLLLNQNANINIFKYLSSISLSEFERMKHSFGEVENFVHLSSLQKSMLRLDIQKVFVPIFYECDAYTTTAFIVVEKLLS